MNSKKILQITLRSSYGGAPKHIDIIINNLSRKHDLFFASPLQEPYGTSWYGFLGKDKFCKIPNRTFSLKYLFKLASFIKNKKIEIIHAHGKGAALYARLVHLLIPKLKVIYTFHGLHVDQYNKVGKELYLLLEKLLALFTNLFINVSQGEQLNCIKHKIFNPSKGIVINNAIEDSLPINKNKLLIRKHLNLPVDKFIIITITRFDFPKNMEEALYLAEELKNINEILFVWVGDGDRKNSISELIKVKKLDNILMPGYKSNVIDYLMASDLYLSNSRWEGLPYSLIEACMLSLPIVASNVIGNNDIVKEDFNGRLFNSGDYKFGSTIINEIYKNKKLLEMYGNNSRQIFLKNYQLKNMITEIDKVYRGL